jgi:hypothetical protein
LNSERTVVSLQNLRDLDARAVSLEAVLGGLNVQSRGGYPADPAPSMIEYSAEGREMSNSLAGVAIDCADALTLSQFWADMLGRQVAEDPTSGYMVLLADGTDAGWPLVVFNVVPEPKTVKNRRHLDLISDTFDAETERLLSLGAQRLRDVRTDKARWTTFADIESNEFDLIAG